MNKRGKLITFEGGEGGGKTTQIEPLKNRLEKNGTKVMVLREPGGTVISEQIREVVLSTKNTGMVFTTEVLLFQAARAQIYQQVVIPALESGKWVLMDRSRDSSVVYQGMMKKFGRQKINELNNMSTQNTYPDLTILLDVSVQVGLKRRALTGEVNRFDLKDQEFHQKVRKAYLQLAKENDHNRWAIVNAEKSLGQVANNIWKIVKDRFKL